VLIVDDSKAMRKTLRFFFEQMMGLNVVAEAEDGQDGVEKFKKHRPQIVVSDIMMPGMSGIETLKAIRAESPNACVIMITSCREKRYATDCVLSGAYDYILKPFEPKRVAAVIKSAIQS